MLETVRTSDAGGDKSLEERRPIHAYVYAVMNVILYEGGLSIRVSVFADRDENIYELRPMYSNVRVFGNERKSIQA